MVQPHNPLHDDISQFSGFWKIENQEPDLIDFMIIVAHDHKQKIRKEALEIQGYLKENKLARIVGKICSEQSRSKSELPRDPFGFRDGIKQPRFFDRSSTNTAKQEKLSPLNIVFRNDIDPFGPGSFLVVRQYQTEIKQFKMDNPDKLQQSAVFGRNSEGIRLIGCPHSHVSRMIGADSEEGDPRKPQIVRRGLVYPADSTNKEGLLFMSFQANIQEQFERLISWANQAEIHDVPRDGNSISNYPYNRVRCDELIGQNMGLAIKPKYVTLLGGEYFFAPPIARFRPPSSSK